MLHLNRVAFLLLGLCPSFALAQLKVTTDRPDARYRIGEKVIFNIELPADRPPGALFTYRISKDGLGTLATREFVSSAASFTVESSLAEAGFLRCDVTATVEGKAYRAAAAAAVDPEKIAPSLPPPDDFDAFWAKQKALLAADPARPGLSPVACPDPAIEAFDLQINCPGGAPVSGYYARPKEAKPRSLPAILYAHSAGVRSSSLSQAVHGARFNAIALDFNAHGLPNGRPDAYYADLADTTLKGYPGRGAGSFQEIYFRGMFLRLLRALDFLASQPEWDGKILIVQGSSQGGGQALVAAGLDSRVTLCLASVPALCDHTAFKVHRAAGWPRLVSRDAAGEYDPQATSVARYFDVVNFAPRIKAKTLLTVGFIDRTCPPSSVYAAYNAIGGDKSILPQPQMDHSFPAPLIRAFDEAIRAYLASRDSGTH